MTPGFKPFTVSRYVANLPRYIGINHFQTTIDDKSGYDHVPLHPHSRTSFHLQWKKYYFGYATFPFGWKASAHNIILLVWPPQAISDPWVSLLQTTLTTKTLASCAPFVLLLVNTRITSYQRWQLSSLAPSLSIFSDSRNAPLYSP